MTIPNRCGYEGGVLNMSARPLLCNMSTPPKTVIQWSAGTPRAYRRGLCFRLPPHLRDVGPSAILKEITGRCAANANASLLELINDHARTLPLPAAAVVTGDHLEEDDVCDDLLTIVTVMSKSSECVYLRDKQPRLLSLRGDRRVTLIVPHERSAI